MKSVSVLLLGALAVVITGCGSNSSEGKADGHEGHDHAAVEAPVATPSIGNANLNALYASYTDLTGALTDGDENRARIAASTFEAGAKELTANATLASSAADIVSASDIKGQRAAFAVLNNEFIRQVKEAGVSEGELYVQYCPMALDNKGASWLSNNKAIRNPYFGESMLTCGEVKETI